MVDDLRMPPGPLAMTFQISPFPPTYNARLKYTQSNILTGGTAGVMGTEQVFRLSSLYDPDFTGTGHQPYGFDQLAALYKKYMVSDVLVKVTFMNPGVNGVACAATIQSSQDALALTGYSPEAVGERSNVWIRPLNATGDQIVTFQQKVPLNVLEGLTRPQYLADTDNYGANVGSNPTLWTTLRVADGSFVNASASAVTVFVELTFDCRFFERITQAQS